MKHPAQIVGNIGLYYACYKLSMLGWNVMPTSRNARGIDVICFSMDGSRMLSFQIKALSKKSPVALGTSLDKIMADFWIIVNEAASETPRCFILLPHEVRALAFRSEKDGKVSYWLQPKAYAVGEFEESWSRIGRGRLPLINDEPKPKVPPKPVTEIPSFGEHKATALARWMGKEGFGFKDARKAMQELGVEIKDSTLHAQLNAGRKELRGAPAKLTDDQAKYLRGRRKR